VQHHQAQLLGAEAELAQADVFRDCVVLAVARAAEELERRRPVVALTLVLLVGPVLPLVEELVDRLKLRERWLPCLALQQRLPGDGAPRRAGLVGLGAGALQRPLAGDPAQDLLPLRQGGQGIDPELSGAEQLRRRGRGGGRRDRAEQPAQHGQSLQGCVHEFPLPTRIQAVGPEAFGWLGG
jgi:hypothetical protein